VRQKIAHVGDVGRQVVFSGRVEILFAAGHRRGDALVFPTKLPPGLVVFLRRDLLPSEILRRLGSFSRKNRLYFALRELGRVVRTMFLCRYISEAELRQAIQAATNKSERFNEFVQWMAFDGDNVDRRECSG
jgi:hypothetical protein